MRQTVTTLLAGALVLVLVLLPATTNAQPTIDGDRAGDSDYEFLAAWNQNDTGFGDHGILELSAFENGSDLYLNIIGEAENNGNCILLFVNLGEPGRRGRGYGHSLRVRRPFSLQSVRRCHPTTSKRTLAFASVPRMTGQGTPQHSSAPSITAPLPPERPPRMSFCPVRTATLRFLETVHRTLSPERIRMTAS